MELKLRIPTTGKAIKTAVAVIAAVLVLGGGYYYYTGTPAYSMDRLQRAFETHDVDAALKYMDLDAIVDDLFVQMNAQLAAEAAKNPNDPGVAFGNVLAAGFLQAFKPVLLETLKQAFISSVKGEPVVVQGKEPEGPASAALGVGNQLKRGDYRIERVEARTYVVFDDGIRLRLEQGRGHHWRVVAIEGALPTSGLRNPPRQADILKAFGL